MSKPNKIEIDGIFYYNAEDIKDYDEGFFIGCKDRSRRTLITKKNLTEDDYIFVKPDKKYGWVPIFVLVMNMHSIQIIFSMIES